VEGNRVEQIRPDKDDPFSRGHICPKAFALQEIQEDPDRLRRPLKRTSSGWKEISWEEALSETAERLAAIQKRDGENAVATYLGNPSVHNIGTALYSQILLGALHTKNKFSASSVDQNPKHAAGLFLYGNVLSIPVPDIDRTNFFLILGANPLASNGSLMTAPDIKTRLRDIKKRGKIVVVDPRRSETAEYADEHLFIRPGQDALLLSALLHTILSEGLTRDGPATKKMTGLGQLTEKLAPFSAEAVAGPTGIPAEKIKNLAREFAKAPTAACYARIGTCLQKYGTLTSWLVEAVNLVTGNVDKPGGAMFTSPAIDLRDLLARSGRGGHRGVWKSRVRGIPEFNGELPVAVLAEEMLTPGPGQIKGLVSIAGNPVLSTPNGKQLDRALSGLEFYVAMDIYLNETTRHAHIILPPTWSLEHDNYEAAFHVFAVRNTSKYSPAVLEPEKGTKHDWEILSDLSLRISQKKNGGPFGVLAGLARRFGMIPSPRRVIDLLLRTGAYGDKFRPWGKGLSLKKLEETPQGIDLGPLVPSLDKVLMTKSKKIELDHPIILGELGKLASDLKAAAAANGDLLLIGRRDIRSNNSWGHNSKLLTKGGARCDLLMHPADAKERGLADAKKVRIKSRVGEVVAPLKLSDEVMPGVVSLPHGWGHDREGVRLSIASESPGVSCNDLTDEKLVENVVGNSVLNGVPVTVTAA
ncbi:MAG: molybdopterin-dependent oxidoreductase, partial [Bdellovibrionota bacterium]